MSAIARNRSFMILARIAVLVSLTVVVLGAYVRLSDAGLGCPDWPGCYGRLFMSDSAAHARIAAESGFERPYQHDKAWKEMVHRYLAGFLGLLILLLALFGWRNRHQPGQPWKIPLLLLVLVLLQAALGMWTVTLLLKPAVVVLHLLGGMTILALLYWVALRLPPTARPMSDRRFMHWGVIALVVVIIQIALGGWVSTNYAALICADFPTCQGQWWPPMDFADGFTFWRGLGVDYEYGVLAPAAMTAIHVAHRIGAIVTLLVVGAVAAHVIISGSHRLRRVGIIITVLLLAQIAMGIANIIWLLPLPLAVAHNTGAALLLLGIVTLLHKAAPGSERKTPSA